MLKPRSSITSPRRSPSSLVDALERRQLLASSVSARAIPADYFRYLQAGSPDQATVAERKANLLDLGYGSFHGTLATFAGNAPSADRVYVRLTSGTGGSARSRSWVPARLVEKTNHTFAVDVDLTLPDRAQIDSTQIAFIDDNTGKSAVIDGPQALYAAAPKRKHPSQTLFLQPNDASVTGFAEDSNSNAEIDLPRLIDLSATDSWQFRVGVDWLDGSPVEWHVLPVEAHSLPTIETRGFTIPHHSSGNVDFRVIIVAVDHPDSVTVRGRFFGNDTAEASSAPTAQAVAATATTTVPSDPAASTFPRVSWSYPWPNDADLPITAIGTLRVVGALPADTRAFAKWPDGSKSVVTLTPHAAEASNPGVSDFDLTIAPHALAVGQTDVTLAFNYDDGKTYEQPSTLEALGDRLWTRDTNFEAWTREGDAATVSVGAFIDGAFPGTASDAREPTDAYTGTLTLDDGSTIPLSFSSGTIRGHFVDVEATASLPLWSTTGEPVLDEEIRNATYSMGRGGDRLTGTLDIHIRSGDWLTLTNLPRDVRQTLGLPKLVSYDVPDTLAFGQNQKTVTLDIATLANVDVTRLSAHVQWDNRHESDVPLRQKSDGTLAIDLRHKYYRDGAFPLTVNVMYGDQSFVSSATAFAGSGDEAVVFKNPTIDNAQAGFDYGKYDIYFGATSVYFPRGRPGERNTDYTASAKFDDGSPARATLDTSGSDRAADEVFVSAYFATAGDHPFTTTIRWGKDHVVSARGIFRAQSPQPPSVGYSYSVQSSDNGIIIGGDGEPFLLSKSAKSKHRAKAKRDSLN